MIKTTEQKQLKVLLKLTGSIGETPLAFWNKGLIFENSPGQLMHVSAEGTRLNTFYLPGISQTNPVVDFFVKKDGELVVLTADGQLFFSTENGFRREAGVSE